MTPLPRKSIPVFISSYHEKGGEGILLYHLDPVGGSLCLQSRFEEGVENPLFAETDRARRCLFVADLVDAFDGKPGGAISAYSIHPDTGALIFLNRKSCEGTVPCYLSVSADRRFLLVANYGDGTVATLPIAADGRLGDAVCVMRHAELAGTKKEAHAHSIVLDASNRFAFAGELGLDRVMIYAFDRSSGRLKPSGSWSVRAGAGPRHFKFHPSRPWAYVINELDNTLVAFSHDEAGGTLKEEQVITTLPDGFRGESYTSDLHVHPNGRFLYGSNRGHDSIVIYAIDGASGRLTLVGHEPTQGNFPRSFAMDPSGTCMLVGNERGDSCLSLRVDPESGRLSPLVLTPEVPSPACVNFLLR